jgi:hypothetical protein
MGEASGTMSTVIRVQSEKISGGASDEGGLHAGTMAL